ncbi:hypothetical protein [Vibrio parahaemolyticus]|uniref:hypothetical protein n=1 Tax=Vibrio parahaemolyticus TaxID=670 RepID=UPI0004A3AE05|nr:hypothetical protein [Vibrio parahaemolyticus]EGU6978768.1 hypothetical protein [Vibrio parahaemolyticus]EIA1556812.1 hypothetical protein [Vibrio parahaemolyticus]EIO2936963.1 hypothetical protein [Vibrio parahaemolyticus]EKB1991309.1 hypothetical protein [Vibrio parahaemolyticus]EME0131625.1 hypothetical protein [Vibrio parahaemolyticus]
MKKVFTILAVSTLAACANINTLENLRNDEPKRERYESGVPLVKMKMLKAILINAIAQKARPSK